MAVRTASFLGLPVAVRSLAESGEAAVKFAARKLAFAGMPRPNFRARREGQLMAGNVSSRLRRGAVPQFHYDCRRRDIAAPDIDARDASDRACAEQVHGEHIRPVGKHVEHAEAEVIRVAPVQDDTPAPVRRSGTGRVRPV